MQKQLVFAPWVTFLLRNITKIVTVLTTEEPHLTALATSIKVSNIKNYHLQNHLLTAGICWTSSYLNTTAAAVNFVTTLVQKSKYEITSCNSQKQRSVLTVPHFNLPL